MLPTIDISNFVRKAVLAVGWVFINPIARTLALAVSVMGLWVSVVSLFDVIPLPQIPVESWSMSGSDYIRFIVYIGSLDVGFEIVNSFIALAYWSVNVVGSLTAGLVVAMWAFGTKETIARAYSHLVH